MGFTNWVRHGQTIIKQKFNELETKWATEWTLSEVGVGGRALIKMYNLRGSGRASGWEWVQVSKSECVWVPVSASECV